MWKHRAYAKAVIRQKEVKLKSSEQLIYLLLADHANEETNQTYFTTVRLMDMTQCARNTVRTGIRKLERERLIVTLYTPGKAPTYTVPIPSGFTATSDTNIATVSRAYVPSQAELAAAATENFLRLAGITADEMAIMVFQNIEGMTAAEAKARAERLFENSNLSPGRTIIEQLGIARNTPFAMSEGERLDRQALVDRAADEHKQRALEEQRQVWNEPRAGESQVDWIARKAKGFPGTDDELLAYAPGDYQALAR